MTNLIIDGDKFSSYLVDLLDQCQLPIKSPAEVERVIRHFQKVDYIGLMGVSTLIDVLNYVIGKPSDYKDEDFEDDKPPAETPESNGC